MLMDTPEQSPLPQNRLCAIEISKESGASEFPAYVPLDDPDWKEQLLDARNFFSGRFEKTHDGIPEFHTVSRLSDAGVTTPASIVPWKQFRANLIETVAHPQTRGALTSLRDLGVSTAVLDALRQDTDFQENEDRFMRAVEEKIEDPEAKEQILTALDIAKHAHEGQTYFKEKYPSSRALAHVPYVNHCIQVAHMGLHSGLSTDAVQALLLHDTLEDTHVTIEDLQSHFPERVISLVRTLTKQPDETREQYMQRICELGGEEKLCKCLDRFHNLLRSFNFQDPDFLDRYAREAHEVYEAEFSQNPKLFWYARQFQHNLAELEKLSARLKDRP